MICNQIDWLGIRLLAGVPAHSASLRAFTPVFDGLWTRVNALMVRTYIPEAVVMGPRNGVPATHSALQTRVNALRSRLARGTLRRPQKVAGTK